MQYLCTESFSHPSFTFRRLLNGRIWLLRWLAAAACMFAFVVPLLDSFLVRQSHTHTYTRAHTHAHIAHAFRWPHNAHIHTCIHIHTRFHARFYFTHTPHFYTLLRTLLSRTSLWHTFCCTRRSHIPLAYICCTRRSFTISFLFSAFPIPSSPFFCCLLEEVDKWGYPAL